MHLKRLHVLPLLLMASAGAVLAFDGAQCCNLAQSRNVFIDPPPPADISCGNTYIDDSIPAAMGLFVSYEFCRSECAGYRKSDWGSPSEWAAPIMQFLLPSIIFSMSIPRHLRFASTDIIEKALIPDNTRQVQRVLRSLLLLLPAILFAALDIVIWIILIMSMAGPMMVAGLHEAMLDFKTLSALVAGKSEPPGGDDAMEQLTTDVELLVAIVSGNLRRGDADLEPSSAIVEALTRPKQENQEKEEEEEAAALPAVKAERRQAEPGTKHPRFSPSLVLQIPERLAHLVTSQLPFGAMVGAPVVFYLGAFIYTVLDLLENPSDQDRAISIAYGVEWMIIVHVAIVSGTLLASNNPGPVVLISLPAAAGAFVSWRTPPVGWGCRSLSFVLYMGWEIVLTPLYFAWLEARGGEGAMEWLQGLFRTKRGSTSNASALIRGDGSAPVPGISEEARNGKGGEVVEMAREAQAEASLNMKSWGLASQISLFLAFLLVFVLAVFTSIVLTLMQIIGVYRNCFCYVTTGYWFRLNEAMVNVANDTIDQRNASGGWITVGITATAFMAVCALLAWWFQRYIRGLYELAIQKSAVKWSSPTVGRDIP